MTPPDSDSEATAPVTSTRYPVTIGDATLDIVVHEGQTDGLTYVAMHDNEDTGAAATLRVLEERGGRFVELQHTGERRVTFNLGGNGYEFDPNRIFTDAGAAATLEQFGAVSEEAVQAVRALADTLLSFYRMEEVGTLIAIHNNTEGNYMASSYAPGEEYEQDAARLAMPDPAEPDDFFFITDATLFDAMEAAGYNVVLQNNETVTDDGSLSVYCGQQGIGYVNVEAQHGHVDEQVRMIHWLADHLGAMERTE